MKFQKEEENNTGMMLLRREMHYLKRRRCIGHISRRIREDNYGAHSTRDDTMRHGPCTVSCGTIQYWSSTSNNFIL